VQGYGLRLLCGQPVRVWPSNTKWCLQVKTAVPPYVKLFWLEACSVWLPYGWVFEGVCPCTPPCAWMAAAFGMYSSVCWTAGTEQRLLAMHTSVQLSVFMRGLCLMAHHAVHGSAAC
jgi:hypothetical protein